MRFKKGQEIYTADKEIEMLIIELGINLGIQLGLKASSRRIHKTGERRNPNGK